MLRYSSFDKFALEFSPAAAPSVVSGHFHFGLHEYFERTVYLIILRDPVERVRSLFSYIRQNPKHRLHAHLNGEAFDLAELYRSEKVARGVQFHDGQVRQLNFYHVKGIEKLTSAHLRFALDVLHREDVVVGFVDTLDLAVANLGKRLDIEIPSVPVTNASASAQIDPKWDELVREYNQLDCQLYDSARAHWGP